MSRRASLPGADELFRAKPLVSVPDVVASEDAVMPIKQLNQQRKVVQFAKHNVAALPLLVLHQAESVTMKKLQFIYHQMNYLI